jgi:aromatic-L-amino-acid decarboxylase
VVCFRREGSDEANEAIVDRVNRSGELFLSHTRLNGKYVIRVAVGNERTTEEDLARAWSALRAAVP